MSGDDTMIRGLSVVDWLGSGVRFTGNNNKLQSSYIGLHADGTTPGSNSLGGVYVFIGNDNVIGTDGDGINDAKEGNVISGNNSVGVIVQSSGVAPSLRNTIAG